MSTPRGALTALVLGATAGAALALVRSCSPDPARGEGPIDRAAVAGPPVDPTEVAAPPAAPIDVDALHARMRMADWLAVGGGAWPEATQVQIEQDVGLAVDAFGGRGVVLFGAGAGAPTVQVQRVDPRDPLGTALADLFSPRGGRDASYRAPAISVDAPATASTVLEALAIATAKPGSPLLVFMAGHGEIGESPRDNLVSLWAASSITAAELAQTLDGAKRPVRLVVTTCFSGGFAELAFRGAREADGESPVERCGLFASTWDLEASGCDPNPDRSVQQGYAMHFLNALRQRDREGHALPLSALDLDGDGAVGLLDAHTRVRIASDGADVPTTTSERWLRVHAPAEGPTAEIAVPEEDAVVRALGVELAIAGHEKDAAARLAGVEDEIAGLDAELERAGAAEDASYRAAAAELLARWPVLDDPWHPDFATTFRSQRAAISELMATSPIYADYLAAREATARIHGQRADLGAKAAPLERLARAVENRALAGRLAARGGDALAGWLRLRACERWSPAPR